MFRGKLQYMPRWNNATCSYKPADQGTLLLESTVSSLSLHLATNPATFRQSVRTTGSFSADSKTDWTTVTATVTPGHGGDRANSTGTRRYDSSLPYKRFQEHDKTITDWRGCRNHMSSIRHFKALHTTTTTATTCEVGSTWRRMVPLMNRCFSRA